VLEVEETLHLGLETLRPCRHLRRGIQKSLAQLAARITDETRAAPDQHDRAVPALLDPPEGE